MKIVTFMITEDQHKKFTEAAKREGMLREHYARTAVIDRVEKDLKRNGDAS